MVSFLIVYATFSGNTQEVAYLIRDALIEEGHEVETFRIGSGVLPEVNKFYSLILGTYTWDKGSTPDEVKDFVYDLGYKPKNVYLFGTGDTQFGGDDLFCISSDKLAKFYNSDYEVLKIEQSPRGIQEEIVNNWAKGVIIDVKIKQSKDSRTNES